MTAKKKTTKKPRPSKMAAKKKYNFDWDEFGIKLAKLEFEQWKHWAGEILDKEPISEERAARWKELMAMNWEDLAPEIQAKDSLWASRIIGVFQEDHFASLVMIANFLLNELMLDWQVLEENETSEFVDHFKRMILTIQATMQS